MYFPEEYFFKRSSFNYPQSKNYSLNKINIEIPVGKRIAIIGKTGSGKSTLCDILLGHLYPSSGTIYLDKKPLNEKNTSNWQSFCSEVPQKIRLLDTTIRENIAFAENNNEINDQNIQSSIDSANLRELIEDLPNKEYTNIGEDGLFRGQRQRISLSRVFYKKSKFIILDEATSALDYKTEKTIIDSLDSFNEKATIVFVSHRLRTLSKCDIIFEISKRCINQGTYNDLCDPNHELGNTSNMKIKINLSFNPFNLIKSFI